MGSFIIAIIRSIRLLLEYIQMKLLMKSNNSGENNSCASKTACLIPNLLFKFILCCLGCLLWCFEKCMKFLNKHAYIQCALFGTGAINLYIYLFNYIYINLSNYLLINLSIYLFPYLANND
jgi:choline transporter-like protein 2/4/5